MKASTKFALVTSFACSTLSMKELSAYGCTCPVVYASDANQNSGNCYSSSYQSSGCTGGCNCCKNSSVVDCDYLGALNSIGEAGNCKQSNALTFWTNYGNSFYCDSNSCAAESTVGAGAGKTITLSGISNTLASSYPVQFGMTIGTNNATQLITTESNTPNYPALYLKAYSSFETYIVDSGVTYQNSIIWVGGNSTNSIELAIAGVYNGVNQWSGNTIIANYSGAQNCSLTYLAGTGGQGDYPDNYDDSIVINQGTITITNNSASIVTLAGVISDNSSTSSSVGSLFLEATYPILLSGVNTYTGGTMLGSGTIQVSNAASFGTVGNLSWGDAVLQAAGSGFSLGLNSQTATVKATTSTLNLNGYSFGFNMSLASNTSNPATTSILTIKDSVGGGFVTLTGNNASYAGGFILESGNTVINSQSSLGSANITLSGGYLAIPSSIGITKINNNFFLDSSGGINVNANGATSANYFNLTGVFSNNGSSEGKLIITNTGNSPGSVTLSGSLSYTGNTTISSASAGVTLAINAPSSSPWATSAVEIGTNGTLNILNAITLPVISASTDGTLLFNTPSTSTTVTTSSDITVQTLEVGLGYGVTLKAATSSSISAASVNFFGNISLNSIIEVTGTPSAISTGVISGSGGFSIASGGTLSLGGQNTFTGGINLESGGSLIAGSNSALGAGSINSSGGTFSTTIGSLNITAADWILQSGTTTFDCIASEGCTSISLGSISSTASTVGILNSSDVLLSFTTMSISDATTLQINAGTGAIQVSSFGEGSGVLSLDGTLSIVSTTSTSFNGSIEDFSNSNSGSLNIQAPVTLTGSNTITGGIILGSGGTLSVIENGSLGDPSGLLTGNGGKLSASNPITVSNPWNFNAGTTTTFAGSINIEGAASVVSSSLTATEAVLETTGSVVVFNFSSMSINSELFLLTNGNDIEVQTFGNESGTLVLGMSGTPGVTDTVTIAGTTTFYGTIKDLGDGGVGAVCITGDVYLNPPITTTGNPFSGGLFLGIDPSGTITPGTLQLGSNLAAGVGTITSYGGALLVGSSLSIPNNWVLNTASDTTPVTTIATTGGTYAVSLGAISTVGTGTVSFINSLNNMLTIDSFTIASGSTLQINAGSGITVSSLGGASGTLALAEQLTINSSTSSILNASIIDFGSPGSLNIDLNQIYTLTLASAVNSFSGGITFTGGTLNITAPGALPNSGVFTGAGGGLSNGTTTLLTINNEFDFTAGTTTTFGGQFTLVGAISVIGSSGTATLARTSSTTATQFSLQPSSLNIPGTLTLATNGNNITTSQFSGTGTLALGSSSTTDSLIINGTAGDCTISITNASNTSKGAVVVTGSVNFLGNNNFSGGFTLGSISGETTTSGTVTVGSATALGVGNTTTNGGLINLGVSGFSFPGSFFVNATPNNPTTTIASAVGGASLGSLVSQLPSGVVSGSATILNNTSATIEFTSLNIATGTTFGIDNSGGQGIHLGGGFGSGEGALLLNGSLTIAPSNSINFNGVIGDLSPGLGSVVIDAATNASVTLSGTNTFSGGLILEQGTFVIGSASALGSGTVTSNGGSISSAISTLSITLNPWVFSATTAAVAPTTTFICNNFSCSSFSLGEATISGASGSVAEIVNNSKTTLTFTSFTIDNGVTVNLNAISAIGISSLIASTGSVNLSGTLNIASTTSSFAGSIGDLIGTGIGTLNITGPVTLGGNNTFSGGIIFAVGGNLSVGSVTNLGASSGTLVGSGGTLTATSPITIANPWTLNTATTMTFGGDITLTGAITISGSNSSTATIAGASLTLTPSSVNIENGTFATNGNNLILGAGGTIGSGTLALGSASTTDALTINGESICDWDIMNQGVGIGSVIINANTTLSGKNSFTGGLTVNNSVLSIESSSALGSGVITSNGATFLSGINNFNPTNSWIMDVGTTTTFGCVSGSCGSTTLSTVSLGGGAGQSIIQNATSQTLKFNSLSVQSGYTASLVTGSGGITIAGFAAGSTGTVEINGVLTLSSGGSFSGVIAPVTGISAELISTVGNTSSFAIGSFSIPASSTLVVSAGSNMSVGSLTGTGILAVAGSLTINPTSAFSFGGTLSDAISLNQTGNLIINPTGSSVVVTFSGANTFSGGLTLANGSLAISDVSNLGLGVITASGGNLTNTSISALTVSNPWTFVGGHTTTIDGGFTLNGSIATSGNGTATLENTANLVLELNNVTLSGINYPALSLVNGTSFATNGHDILLQGYFGTGGGTLLLGAMSTTDTFTINNTTAAVSFSGNINDFNSGSGALGAVVIGSPVTLTGNNAFTGGLTLGSGTYPSDQGNLTIQNNNAVGAGTIIGNGGILSTSNSFTINNPWTFITGTSSSTSFDVSNTTSNQGNVQTQTLTLKGNLSTEGGGTAYIYNTGTGTLVVNSSSICGTYVYTNQNNGVLTWNSKATCSVGAVSESSYLFADSFSSYETLQSPSNPVIDVIVESGLLRGTGEVTNLAVQSGAAVAPGTESISRGTFTVLDSVSFAPHTIFFAGADDTSSAQIIAGGSVIIDSESNVFTIPVGLTQSCQHVILQAESITGQFNNLVIIPSVAFLEGELLYDVPNQVSMKITALSIGQTSIVGANAQHVAAALDEAIAYNRENVSYTISCCPPSVDPTTPPVLEEILISLRPFIDNSNAMSAALDQLHPAVFKGLTVVQENNIVQVQKTVEGRIEYLLDTTSCYNVASDTSNQCCKGPDKVWDFWADGLAAILHQDSNWSAQSPQVGYESTMAGFTLGLDAHFAKYFYLGVMGGYTSSFVTFHSSRGTGNIETGYGGAYFSAVSDMFYGNISVVGASNNLSGHRYISYTGVHEKAKHSTMGSQLLSHADTGININVMDWFKVRPFDSFDYVTQTEDSYTETGAGDWNLHVSKKNAIMMRNELGIALSSCLCFASQKWVISPKASWVREVRVKGGGYSASFAAADPIVSLPYTVNGYFPNRNLFSPGLSLTGSMCQDKLSVELYYNGEFAHGYSNNAFGGQIRVAF